MCLSAAAGLPAASRLIGCCRARSALMAGQVAGAVASGTLSVPQVTTPHAACACAKHSSSRLCVGTLGLSVILDFEELQRKSALATL